MLKQWLALIPLLPLPAVAQDVSKVTVRDQDFQLVRMLTSAPDLAAFNKLWSARTAQESASGRSFLYKIEVERGGRSVRWLYDPAGFLQVLTVARTPTYGLAAPQAFNRLLAIDQH